MIRHLLTMLSLTLEAAVRLMYAILLIRSIHACNCLQLYAYTDTLSQVFLRYLSDINMCMNCTCKLKFRLISIKYNWKNIWKKIFISPKLLPLVYRLYWYIKYILAKIVELRVVISEQYPLSSATTIRDGGQRMEKRKASSQPMR